MIACSNRREIYCVPLRVLSQFACIFHDVLFALYLAAC